MSKCKKYLAMALALVMVLTLAGFRTRDDAGEEEEAGSALSRSVADKVESRIRDREENAGEETDGESEEAASDAVPVRVRVPESWGTPRVWALGTEALPDVRMEEDGDWYVTEAPQGCRYLVIAGESDVDFKTAGAVVEDAEALWIVVSGTGETAVYVSDPTAELEREKDSSFAALVGVWSLEIDCFDFIAEAAADVVGDIAELLPFSDYIEHFYVPLLWEIREDHSYSVTVDTDALGERLKELRGELYDYFYDAAVLSVKETLEEQGAEIGDDVVTALEELLGLSMEAVLEDAIGMDLESYVDTYISESDFLEAFNVGTSGTLEARGGRLVFDGDEEDYNTYEISALTITGGSAGDDGDYPLVLSRVS